MKPLIPAALVLLSGAALLAQAHPVPAAPPHSYSSELGFSYQIPGDWDVADAKANMAQARQQAAEKAGSEQEKKGLACVQMGLTAHHASSVIVDVALPFDCFGQQLSDTDLPGFGEGASQGVKQSFDIGEPTNATYALGSHNMWVQRVKGTLKGQPSPSFTIEITCAVLKKAAVCWMAMAEDDAALQVFEHTQVSLDGDAPATLVPPTAFVRKPS